MRKGASHCAYRACPPPLLYPPLLLLALVKALGVAVALERGRPLLVAADQPLLVVAVLGHQLLAQLLHNGRLALVARVIGD